MGWYLVGALDVIEEIPKEYKIKKDIITNITETIRSIIQYQDIKTGLWYQIVDKPEDENNWIELSCSALFIYAISKAIHMGLLSPTYINNINKAYDNLIKYISVKGNKIIMPKICVGTGVGEYDFYINRPTSQNDLHGIGAFVLMNVEYASLLEKYN